ncbi:hypothetical protein KXR64_22500 [Brucella intermedia]|uniref:hypothetical protein n=1 Tax=Brucella TaxID=234 RepID=UPI0009462EFF|nr:hypothetical protein [Brucella intermedia]
MTTIVTATDVVKTSLTSIIKRQMIDIVIDSRIDPSVHDEVALVLRKANFGEPAIVALAEGVAKAAQIEIKLGSSRS